MDDWDQDPSIEANDSDWEGALSDAGQLGGRPVWHYLAAGSAVVVVLLAAFMVFPRPADDDSQAGVPVTVLGTTTLAGGDLGPTTVTLAEPSGAPTVQQIGGAVECVGGTATPTPTQSFLDAAFSQVGDPYEFGAEADLSDPDPASFDTSELIQWSAARAGITITDGSWLQYLQLAACGGELSVGDALMQPGTLVFGFPEEPTNGGPRPAGAFVAISLGDGDTILDVTSEGGVEVRSSTERQLTHAAIIPDLGQAQLAP